MNFGGTETKRDGNKKKHKKVSMPFKIISCSAKRLYDMNMLANSIFYIHRERERERKKERERERKREREREREKERERKRERDRRSAGINPH